MLLRRVQIASKATRALALLGMLAAAAPSASAVLDWTRRDAATLIELIEEADREGLDPDDYQAPAVAAAIASGDEAAIDAAATASALALAGDYWAGRVPPAKRADWHIASPTRADPALSARIDAGLRARRLRATFQALLPSHPEYRRLRDALGDLDAADATRRGQLRVNMERWRWMPRDLGDRYVLVNVPAFALKLMDGSTVVEERPVIVGKRATATPQFSATITGVILNPWWEVPQSIVVESIGDLIRRQPTRAAAQGYVMQRGANGAMRVRQKPGAQNALGQMKLVMPNRFNVYLHDTPNRGKFDQADRALSHGCIRVKGAIDFAARLLADQPAWPRAEIDRVLASGASVKADLRRPLPVHIGYFTAASQGDRLAFHGDLYGRDAAVLRALDAGKPLALAAAPTATCPA